jgi:hypothetical protein
MKLRDEIEFDGFRWRIDRFEEEPNTGLCTIQRLDGRQRLKLPISLLDNIASVRAKVETAIRLLHDESGWDDAMEILTALAGRPIKCPTPEPATFSELARAAKNCRRSK